MTKRKIDRELLKIAEKKGLSAEEVRRLMTGEGVFPEEFMDAIEVSAGAVNDVTCKDEKDDRSGQEGNKGS